MQPISESDLGKEVEEDERLLVVFIKETMKSFCNVRIIEKLKISNHQVFRKHRRIYIESIITINS